MDEDKKWEKYDTGFFIKNKQDPTDQYQNVYSQRIVKKIGGDPNITVLGKFGQIRVDAQAKQQQDERENDVKIFVVLKTFIHRIHLIKIKKRA